MKKINLFTNSSSAAAIDIDTLQSQVIDLLRFPLIVGVMFAHADFSVGFVSGLDFGDGSRFPVYYACSQLFSSVLGSVAVPLFFFMSGFLFFRNIDFDGRSYVRKLRSRARSLLVPYLFWILATLLLLVIAQSFRGLDAFANGKHIDFTWRYAIQTFWGVAPGAQGSRFGPIPGHFWFIRDLMVLIVLTPLVHVYVRKLKVYGVVLLCLLWFLGWWWINIPGFSGVATFFFTAGAWFSLNKRNLALEAEKVKYLSFALYPLLAVADLLTKGSEFNFCAHNLGILVGILFCLNIGLSSIRTTVITTAKYKATKAASLAGFNHINEKFLIGVKSQGEWTAKTKNDAAERNLLGTITVVLIELTPTLSQNKIPTSIHGQCTQKLSSHPPVNKSTTTNSG
jgi:fucose 4-O-acetylase-like acetyltransferase